MKMNDRLKRKLNDVVSSGKPKFVEARNKCLCFGFIQDFDDEQLYVRDYENKEHWVAIEFITKISDYIEGKKKGRDHQ